MVRPPPEWTPKGQHMTSTRPMQASLNVEIFGEVMGRSAWPGAPGQGQAKGGSLGEKPLRAPRVHVHSPLGHPRVRPDHLRGPKEAGPGRAGHTAQETHCPATTVSAHVTVDLEAGGVVCGEDRVNAVLLLSTQEDVQTVAWPRA